MCIRDRAGAALREACQRAGAGSAPVPPRRPDPAGLGPRPPLMLRSEHSEQAHLMTGVPGLARHDPRRPALAVLNTALGGGPSSRLFQQVREQRGLAYSVYSTYTTYADTGSVAVYAGCAPDRLGEVADVVREVLDDVAAGGVTPAEVTRAKGNLRGGLVLGLEDAPSRMNRLGRAELDHGRQRTIAESLDQIAAVTPEDVAALAKELLAAPLTTAVVGPYEDEADLPAALRELATVD